MSDSEGVVSPGYQHVVSYSTNSAGNGRFQLELALVAQPQEQLNFVCVLPRYPRNWALERFE